MLIPPTTTTVYEFNIGKYFIDMPSHLALEAHNNFYGFPCWKYAICSYFT